MTSAQRLVLGAPLAPGLRQINVAILLMSRELGRSDLNDLLLVVRRKRPAK